MIQLYIQLLDRKYVEREVTMGGDLHGGEQSSLLEGPTNLLSQGEMEKTPNAYELEKA